MHALAENPHHAREPFYPQCSASRAVSKTGLKKENTRVIGQFPRTPLDVKTLRASIEKQWSEEVEFKGPSKRRKDT
jgi:hypothetical protein